MIRAPAPTLPLLLALALLLPPAPAAAQEAQDPVEPWLRARARAFRAWSEGDASPAPPRAPGARPWRERGPDDPALPDFVPPTSVAPLIRAVQAGVVNIATTDAAGGAGTGSGFVLGEDGAVVTNNHVVARARVIRVLLADGREYAADVVGRDAQTDVALLQLRGLGRTALPAVFLGDSDTLQVGDWVVAIGNPFALGHSVTHGMISARERYLGVSIFDDFIQTDALINPGNSGGPLFNMRGEVVGVNTAIVSQGQGIGFAVPINLVKDLLPGLQTGGARARGWLGVVLRETPAGAGGPRSAVVKTVTPGGPAAAAGVLPGDRILALNGRAVESYAQAVRAVALLPPGAEVRLSVSRDGHTRELTARLMARPTQDVQAALQSAGNLDAFGLVLQDLTPQASEGLGRRPYDGVVVAGVTPGGPAQAKGVRAGDVVVEVNRRPVRDVAGVRAAMRQSTDPGKLLLRVQRGESLLFVALER